MTSKIEKFRLALGLENPVIGVKFLKNFSESNALELKNCNVCEMLYKALGNKSIKCNKDFINCNSCLSTLGFYYDKFGKFPKNNKCIACYESLSIDYQVNSHFSGLKHNYGGIELKPFNNVDEHDLILIICKSKDVMRIIQGYTRYYGVPRNLNSMGTKSICGDLIAQPFKNNDLNISLLNIVLDNSKITKGDMGVSFPVHMFNKIIDGVLETVNLTENNKPKRELLKRLNSPDELGFPIIMNYDYAIKSSEYSEYAEKCIEYSKRKEEV